MAEKKTGFKKIKENKSKKIKNWNKISKIQLLTANWEFKKKGRLPQRNCHIKIELSVISTVFRLFHVVHVVGALLLAWHECFSHKGRKLKIDCYGFAFSSEPQISKFCLVVRQTTSNYCTIMHAARGTRLFSLIQPNKLLICGVVVAVDIVIS